MSQTRKGPLVLIAVLLASCTSGATDVETPAQPPALRDQAAALPTGDTGAIDLSSLEGRIAFGVGTDIESTEVYVVGADGSGLTRLTRNNVADFDPSWSPDGSRIVFRSQRDGNDEIYVMREDGSGPGTSPMTPPPTGARSGRPTDGRSPSIPAGTRTETSTASSSIHEGTSFEASAISSLNIPRGRQMESGSRSCLRRTRWPGETTRSS